MRRGQPAAALSADADERSERRSIMLKFLTHKLRTHSLNEESVSEKVGVGAAYDSEGHSATRKWPPQNKGAEHPAAGPRPELHARLSEAACLLQVEERDSGTESDDEAERAEPGEYCSATPSALASRFPASITITPGSTSLTAG